MSNTRPYQKDSLRYYYNLANTPKTPSSLAEAYLFFNKQKEESLLLKDTLSTINHLRQIAIIQFKLGDYYGSETSVVSALGLLDLLKNNKPDNENKVGLYNQLGRINKELLDYDTALKYYNEALKFAHSKANINIIKNNKALIYIDQSHFALAEKELKTIYENSLPLGDTIQIARALDNLGYVQFKLKRKNALDKLFKALEIRISIEDIPGTYSSYKYLSEYYRDQKDTIKALDYANKAYKVAKSIKSASYIEDALSNLVTLNNNSKVLEYKRIKDSISHAKQIADNKYAFIKFNYLKQEKIATQNKLQKEQERSKRITYQSIGLLITVVSIFLFYILNQRHQKEKRQQVYITETRISKKVHDEVANDVYNVISKLQTSSIKKGVLKDLEDIYIRTRDISKENSAIDVEESYEGLLRDLFLSFKNDDINVIAKNISKVNWNTIESNKKTTLYRVLQELLVNMKKHSQASLVAFNFNQTWGKIHITYTDNGIGGSIKKSTGLQNVENRIKSIGGTIIFDSEINKKGFKVKISI
ncbi:ATP-binding protein [Flavivirga sp. 57AJ16]|uniref:tetratricopeptide repeat-containing sensor histidine kinase n=1 Tax=Flavivirga sp. 57AJ16 TaxID=3025307 RepID=UPI002365E465|nr:ATP-binding protein [Flavivirga sp. 57AJ16]MDD7887110.1 ATP-binding protein [Flavivirga sp. 57AJ16]